MSLRLQWNANVWPKYWTISLVSESLHSGQNYDSYMNCLTLCQPDFNDQNQGNCYQNIDIYYSKNLM